MARPVGRYIKIAIIAAMIGIAAIVAAWFFNLAATAFIVARSASTPLTFEDDKNGGEVGTRIAISVPLLDQPRVIPNVQFVDGDGGKKTLAEFKGKVIALNLWATWCIPCRREMPTLDRLQAELGGPKFQVLALSIDRAGLPVVRKFYAETGVKHLAMYNDSSGIAARQLGAVGLPVTLLIDRQGLEIGRLVGPAEWDAPEMIALIRGLLAKHAGLPAPAAGNRRAAQGEANVHAILTFQPVETLPLPQRSRSLNRGQH